MKKDCEHYSFVYASNNMNGFFCAKKISELGFCPELLIFHPIENQKCVSEIINVFPSTPFVFWKTEECKKKLLKTKTEILLSINFAYLFPKEVLSLFKYPINLHTGLLPFNRGMNPNVWSIYEQTPAGVTLHLMTEALDKGEVIAQREVPVSPLETGKTLYVKLEEASVSLIEEEFPRFMKGEISSLPMPEGGTYHESSEFRQLCSISLDETIKVEELLRRLRALSFPPYKNAYINVEGKRVFVDISFSDGNE